MRGDNAEKIPTSLRALTIALSLDIKVSFVFLRYAISTSVALRASS